MAALVFPFKGLHVGSLPGDQPPQTSPKLLNCRALWRGRFRGGQRPGLAKWATGDQIGATEQPVVAMCSVSVVESL